MSRIREHNSSHNAAKKAFQQYSTANSLSKISIFLLSTCLEF